MESQPSLLRCTSSGSRLMSPPRSKPPPLVLDSRLPNAFPLSRTCFPMLTLLVMFSAQRGAHRSSFAAQCHRCNRRRMIRVIRRFFFFPPQRGKPAGECRQPRQAPFSLCVRAKVISAGKKPHQVQDCHVSNSSQTQGST